MARSHHRKKHKQQLRSYQHSKDVAVRTGKNKVTLLFALLGMALGIGITYFALNTMVSMVIGALAGVVIGYLIGKKIDENP